MRRVLRLAPLAVIAGLCFPAIASVHANEARAEGGATITISTDSADPKYSYTFNPAELNAKAGQAITVTNEDPNGVHAVTAKDGSFNVDVPPKATVTFKIDKPGSHPYYCQYHSDQHNPATINVS